MTLSVKPISVVIADDHEIFRHGLKLIFVNHYSDSVQIIAEAGDGVELIALVEELKPDVVLTDIKMPVMNGIEACKKITAKHPRTKTIALSLFDETDSVVEMLHAGASGYLIKSTSGQELITAIRTVVNGDCYYCSSVSDKLYGSQRTAPRKSRTVTQSFTKQEVNVMKLLCQQLTTKEIADSLGLATRTIEDYRNRIQEKTGARNMVGVALYAMYNRIIQWGEI